MMDLYAPPWRCGKTGACAGERWRPALALVALVVAVVDGLQFWFRAVCDGAGGDDDVSVPPRPFRSTFFKRCASGRHGLLVSLLRASEETRAVIVHSTSLTTRI